MIFHPRENLKRTLTYGAHSKASYQFALGLAFFFFIAGCIDIVQIYEQTKTNWAPIAFGDFAIAIAVFYQAYFVARPLAHSKVFVRPDGVLIELDHKNSEFYFSDIKSLQFAGIPYVVGWLRVELNDGRIFKFIPGLERREYILEAIASANPKLVENEELMDMRTQLILSDHAFARLSASMETWPKMLGKMLILSVAAALISKLIEARFVGPYDFAQFGSLLSFVIVSYCILKFTDFTLTNLILGMQRHQALQKDPTAIRRDMVLEARSRKTSNYILVFCMLVLVPLFLGMKF